MSQTFKKLFQPVKIGSLQLKNRYVMNATHLGFESDSFVGKRTIDFYRERAKGGVGLIIAGGFKVENIGYGPTFLSIADDDYLPGLRDLTSEVKKEGAKIFAQLVHAGRYVHSSKIGQQPVSPSAVRSRLTGEEPRALSIEEIKRLVDKYAETARRAKNAGFDGVEIIASTGYLISQFLSPLTNRRDDEYGGDLSNRMRFGLGIAESVRKAVGSGFPLIFRVSGNDFMKGGNTNKEAAIFSGELEHSGVDAINVQSGWHEAGVPTVQPVVPPGAFVYLSRAIKEEVLCPVMTCNKLGDPYLAEEVLRDGHADLIGMARPFLADPYLPRKVQEGRVDEIVRCVSCCSCLDRIFAGRPVACMVNPFVGREGDWKVAPARAEKKILVIGGGPAGMEAARIAAKRGHQVFVYEKTEKLGGQINLARLLPNKSEFGMLADDLRTCAIRNGVKVKTGIEVTSEIVEDLSPDAVVVATGAEQRPYSIPGAERENVFNVVQLLEDNIETGKRIVVIGGGNIGCDVALLLVNRGVLNSNTLSFLFRMEAEDVETLKRFAHTGAKEVTLITRQDKVGKDIGQATRWIFLNDFQRLNGKVVTRAENISITANGVCFDVDAATREIPADTVVISPGMTPVSRLYENLKGSVKEIYLIGDAKNPRNAIDAIYEGAHVGSII